MFCWLLGTYWISITTYKGVLPNCKSMFASTQSLHCQQQQIFANCELLFFNSLTECNEIDRNMHKTIHYQTHTPYLFCAQEINRVHFSSFLEINREDN